MRELNWVVKSFWVLVNCLFLNHFRQIQQQICSLLWHYMIGYTPWYAFYPFMANLQSNRQSHWPNHQISQKSYHQKRYNLTCWLHHSMHPLYHPQNTSALFNPFPSFFQFATWGNSHLKSRISHFLLCLVKPKYHQNFCLTTSISLYHRIFSLGFTPWW